MCRRCAQVRAKMQATKSGTIEHEQLQTLVACVSSADILSDPTRVKKMKWVELEKCVKIVLEADGIGSLPTRVALTLTRRYAESMLEDERWDDWVKVVAPGQSADDQDEGWSIAAPCFWALRPGDSAEDIEKAAFVEQLCGSFCNDLGMRMFANVSNHVSGAKDVLVGVSHKFLEAMADYSLQTNSAIDIPNEYEPLVKLFRGVSALVHPVPGAFSAAAGDADFVADALPKKPAAGQRMDGIALPASRVMHAHVRDSPVWQEHYRAYVAFGAAEMRLGADLRNHMDCLQKAIDDPTSWGDRASYLEEACNAAGTLKMSLRPGAIGELEARAMKCSNVIMKMVVDNGLSLSAGPCTLR